MTILLKYQPWWPPDRREDQATAELEWNMWKSRQVPFNTLSDGDAIFGVSAGGPSAGVIMFEMRVLNVVKARYDDHDHAWALLKAGIPKTERQGDTRRSFLNDPYTLAAPATGWLLAWSSEPAPGGWLGRPRPEGFRFRPNGWGKLEELPRP